MPPLYRREVLFMICTTKTAGMKSNTSIERLDIAESTLKSVTCYGVSSIYLVVVILLRTTAYMLAANW